MGKQKYPMVYEYNFIEKEIKNHYGIMGRKVFGYFVGIEKDFEEYYKNDFRLNENDVIITKRKVYIYGKKRERLPIIKIY